MEQNKKVFSEPECEVTILNVTDVITTSEDNWWMEEV